MTATPAPTHAAEAGARSNDVILEVDSLEMHFPITRGLLKRKVGEIKAVDGVSFTLRRGETLGLVGESGCGKTTIGRCISRLYKPTGGRIWFDQKDISSMPEKEFRPFRRQISVIFQDPYGSLDPRQTAGSIVGEPLKVHELAEDKADYWQRVETLIRSVGLDPGLMGRYPHEFSGGQRQRIGIARALAGDPKLIICDEPVSALDVSIQAQIINLLMDLKEGLSELTYIFIAHDLSVVRHISDRIAVMYLGHIMEITTPEELYSNPVHPYTQALLSAVCVPDPDLEATRERIILEGEVPSPVNPPAGCVFHARCPKAKPECSKTVPGLRLVADDHEVACLRAE
ncbi:MAG: peptide ABC transporter substrate-binding protein [Actinobacteria bacterium RBG_16_64_13]|nr:MAG: peptide ABC transporter substrate-binding protein [Actinobacteria bacterium RBG_16_64_13]